MNANNASQKLDSEGKKKRGILLEGDTEVRQSSKMGELKTFFRPERSSWSVKTKNKKKPHLT